MEEKLEIYSNTKNEMKAFIEEKTSIRAKHYKEDLDELKHNANNENRTKDDYKGRELFELLQNADDQMDVNVEKIIKIEFDDDYLTIFNNGRPFDKDGIRSLMYSDLSPKKSHKEIGCKGLGFRSILGWTDEISIDSGDLHVVFSEKISKEQLLLLSNDNSLKKEQPATLEFPKWNDEYEACDYTTRIKLKIKSDSRVLKDINKQLNDLDAELLLFLNNTERLDIVTENEKTCYKKEYLNEEKDYLKLARTLNDKTKEENWYILSTSGKTFQVTKDKKKEQKTYRVSIAYKENGKKPKKQLLYSYFPTKIDFKYPFLVHATYDLDSTRNLILDNDANRDITKTVAEMMVKMSSRVFGKSVNYNKLWLLLANWDFPQALLDVGIEEALKLNIKKEKLFPTVNGKFISYSNKPVFMRDNKLPDYLKGNDCKNLLLSCNKYDFVDIDDQFDIKYSSFINHLTDYTFSYSNDELKSIINNYTRDMKYSRQNAEKLSIIASNVYKIADTYSTNKNYFCLMFDSKQKITNCSKTYFTSKAELTNPPEFLRFDFIDSYYYEKLRLHSNSAIEWLNIRDTEFKTIIEEANNEIDKLIKKKDLSRAKECSISFIKWLWENRKKIEYPLDEYSIKIITRKERLVNSTDLYYGQEYGNELLEELLSFTRDDVFVCDIRNLFDISDASNKQLIEFLESLGVNRYPRKMKDKIDTKDISEEERKELLMHVARSIKGWPFKITGIQKSFNNLDEFIEEARIIIPYTSIEYLRDILLKQPTSLILKWIDEDEELKELILDKRKDPIYKSSSWPYCPQIGYWNVIPKYDESLKKIESYMYFVFRNTKWIDVHFNGKIKKVKPTECIINNEYTNILAPIVYSVDVSDYSNKKEEKKEMKSLLLSFGVAEKIDKLSAKKIYSIMNSLSKKENINRNILQIYNCIANSESKFDEKELLQVKEYERFLKNGFVLTNNGFQPCGESYYQTNFGLCEQIKNKYNIIVLQPKLRYETVRIRFGVKQLSIKGELIDEPIIHAFNYEFLDEFIKFKNHSLCYALDFSDDEAVSKFKDLKIVLCEEIKAKFENDIVDLNDYDYINKSSTYYLKTPDSINRNNYRKDNKFAKSLADIVCSILFKSYSESDRLQLLFSMNDGDRISKICADQNDDEIIARSIKTLNNTDTTKTQFLNIIDKLSSVNHEKNVSFIETIDFDNIRSNQNAKTIIDYFKEINIDIFDYNKKSPDVELSLVPYYKNEINKLKQKNIDYYYAYCFDKLKNSSLEEKKKLRDLFCEYEEKEIEIVDSVNFDVHDAFMKEFEISSESIDVNSIYNNNLLKLKEIYDFSDEFEDFINKPEPHSLIYFAEFDEIITMFNNSKTISSVNKESIVDNSDVKIKSVIIEPIMISEKKKTQQKKSNKPVGYSNKQNKELEETGKIGEKRVYEQLLQQGKNVKWVSENALKEGVNSEGEAGKHYDLLLIENDNITYIDVKASSGNEVNFEMSSDEYEFAKEHCDNYEIYFVNNIDSTIASPNIFFLGKIFNKDGIVGIGKTVILSSKTQYFIKIPNIKEI